MKRVAIIQARMGSSRLPGKTLEDICGQPLIGHVIDRVQASRSVDATVVATTTQKEDDVLVRYLLKKNVSIFRGDASDVLDRFYRAAEEATADVVIRITADDPFKDPAVIDLVAETLSADPLIDYASNTIVPTFPEGLDLEVFRFDALAKAWREARLPSEREHVTPYIWTRPQMFQIRNVTRSPDLSHLRWTLDYPEDLAFTRAVYTRLYRGQVFSSDEILALLRREPALEQINRGFTRNAGYLQSLKQETSNTL